MTDPIDIVKSANQINERLVTYSPKDWNYSLIKLVAKDLRDCCEPYVLWVEVVDPRQADKKRELKGLAAEVKWGSRHSSELGILELVSLRLNKALLESTTDADWDNQRPIIRLVSPKALVDKGITIGLGYEITELPGDEFDNR